MFEAKGLHVLPGVMDTQVHFREPGNTHKEDLASGSLAAILGGVTPCSKCPTPRRPPPPAPPSRTSWRAAKGRMHCDHAFYVGATPANIGALGELERCRAFAASRRSWVPPPELCCSTRRRIFWPP